MNGISATGDPNTGGGVVTSSQSWVTVDGSDVSVDGSPVSSHDPCPVEPVHCDAVTASGDSWITIDGVPVNFEGDADTCSHTRTSGHSWVTSNT